MSPADGHEQALPADDDPAAAAFANLAKLSRSDIDPRKIRPQPKISKQTDQPRKRRRWSGAGPSVRDPKPIGDIFTQISRTQGWAADLQRGRVLSEWASIVGQDVAAKTTPTSLQDGNLVVHAASTSWATQLNLMKRLLHQRIDEKVGPNVVRTITIRGPAAPSWKKGPRSVRGRGPRDTYG
ncbi:DUF721 domain-containing protein [Epidermidibacterium keratini]|uniref:DUF721 domain-containing protein n=1 Tax=Epidermidibacterium keratini TaxID=1891644 RepID=A0A7L4YMH2_9ACTN|nr:DciA family protein [Epidermidibacterium keratini]QHC00475.1 DUF721 domain-containing protein [Epidermidibacterium keratini]